MKFFVAAIVAIIGFVLVSAVTVKPSVPERVITQELVDAINAENYG